MVSFTTPTVRAELHFLKAIPTSRIGGRTSYLVPSTALVARDCFSTTRPRVLPPSTTRRLERFASTQVGVHLGRILLPSASTPSIQTTTRSFQTPRQACR